MPTEMSKVGKRGAVVIPASLRRRFGIKEGSLVIAEGRAKESSFGRLQHSPLRCMPRTPRLSFLLSNAVGAKDYVRAKEEVRKMGLDPRKIPHL